MRGDYWGKNMWDWLLPAAGAAIGLIGGSKGSEQQTTGSLDPRLAKFVYGDEGSGTTGILTDANKLYQKQMAEGGMNDIQRTGIARNLALYDSPFMTSGTDAMTALINKYLGKSGITQQITPYQGGLLSNSGNTSSGYTQLLQNGGTRQQQQPAPAVAQGATIQAPQPALPPEMYGGFRNGNTSSIGREPQGFSLPSISFPTFDGATPSDNAATDMQATVPQQQAQGGWSSSDAPGGQGVNQTAINLGLKALATSKNPAVRVLSPTIAALLGIGGTIAVDRQVNALGNAADTLAANQGPNGMGTVADAAGNVRTYSSPATLAAQDAASFDDSYGNQGLTFGGFNQGGRFSGGGNLSGMGGAQGISGTANTGGYGFSGGGGLGFGSNGGTGLRGSW